jgi:hypothetical protein
MRRTVCVVVVTILAVWSAIENKAHAVVGTSDLVHEWVHRYLVAEQADKASVLKKAELAVLLPGDVAVVRRQINEMKQASADPNELDALGGVETQLAALVSTAEPTTYPPGRFLVPDACYKPTLAPECDHRLGGFAVAAFERANGYECWEGVENRNGEFVDGYIAWWKRHADPTMDAKKCVPPPMPARCFVAYCSPHYKTGVAFRPSADIGTTAGKGLGFNDGKLAAQLAGTVGARFFWWSDAVDVHSALGIATSSTSGDGKNASPYLLLHAGLGFYNGLFAISYMHTFDPFENFPAGSRSGDGVSIYVDAAAVQRIGH